MNRERARIASRLRQNRFLSRGSPPSASRSGRGSLPKVKGARPSPRKNKKYAHVKSRISTNRPRVQARLVREGATAVVAKALAIHRRVPPSKAAAIARKFVARLSLQELVEVDAGRFDLDTAIPRARRAAAPADVPRTSAVAVEEVPIERSAVAVAAAASSAAAEARAKARIKDLTPELTMWDAIVRDDVKRHALEEVRAVSRERHVREAYRSKLDVQVNSKEDRIRAAEEQRENERILVASQVAQFHSDERAKAARLRAKAEKLKALQDEQLNSQRAAKKLAKAGELEEARLLHLHLVELDRKAELKEERRMAEALRRIASLQEQHEAHLVAIATKKQQDAEDAIRLQREYTEREERNEKRRADEHEERAARIRVRMARMASGALKVEADQRAEERRLMERDIMLADAAKAAKAKAKADKLAATIADLTQFNQMRLDIREKERLVEEEEKIARRIILDRKARAEEEKEAQKQAKRREVQRALAQDLRIQMREAAKRRNINVVDEEVAMNAGILRGIMKRNTTPTSSELGNEIVSPLLHNLNSKRK